MTNNDADLEIVVGAVADEKSAEKAVKDIAKKVDSSVKGGHIDISVPINIDDKQLVKAQKSVVKEIEKLTSEGFSASGKDIVELNKKFNKFKTAFKDSGGIQKYSDTFKEIQKQVTKLEKQFRKAETSSGIQKFSQEVINKALEKSFNDSKARSDKRKQFRGVKSVGPKGYPNSRIDPGGTNDYVFRLSEKSPYGSNWARQMKLSELASIKWMKKSLKIYQNNKLANQFADEAYTRGMPVKNQIIEKDKHGNVTTRYEDGFYRGSKKSDTYTNKNFIGLSKEQLNNIGLAEASFIKLSEILNEIEKNTADVSIDNFNKFLSGAMQFGGKAGQGYESILLALDTVFGKYFDTNGALGIGYDKEKGVGEGHEEAQKAIVGMITSLKKAIKEGFADKAVKIGDKLITITAEEARQLKELGKRDEIAAGKEIDRILKGYSTSNNSKSKEGNTQLEKEINKLNNNVEKQIINDKIENSAERVADSREEQLAIESKDTNKQIEAIAKQDVDTGFNSDTIAQMQINKTTATNKILGSEIETILINIFKDVKAIKDSIGGGKDKGNKEKLKTKTKQNLPIPEYYQKWFSGGGEFVKTQAQTKAVLEDLFPRKWLDTTNYTDLFNQINKPSAVAEVEAERALLEKGLHPSQQRSSMVELSNSVISVFKSSKLFNTLKTLFGGTIKSVEPEINKLLAMSQNEQEKLYADLIDNFGIAKTDVVGATGDKIRVKRVRDLFGWGKKDQPNPFENLKLTEGINLDTKAISSTLQTMIEKNMFKAQTGGVLRNIIGSTSFYLGMPSLEKTRAQAEAANQILADIRNAAQILFEKIKQNETDLRGLEKKGRAKFNEEGKLIEGSPEAWNVFANLEAYKKSLTGVLAEAEKVNKITNMVGGNAAEFFRYISFVAPELRNDNIIVQNINAGLNKNGKALKFQTRTGEVLNYTFQLMARSIGQMWKNWMAQLNPINLIKKAFSDFTSYNTEWQRTMNVIKYNLRAVILPIMEKIAQIIVNIIGLLNSFANGFVRAFGGKGFDIFDKSAASAEKMKEELEAGANVTASFDELHDIGSDNSGANDLFGDIYTPQWTGMQTVFENIGKLIGGITVVLNDLFNLDGSPLLWTLAKIVGFLTLVKLGVDVITATGIVLFIDGVVQAITNLIEYIQDPSWQNFGEIIQGVGKALLGLGLIFGNLPLIITGAITLAVGILLEHWEEIKAFLQKGIDWLAEKSDWIHEHLGNVIGAIYDGIVRQFQLLLNWFNDVFTGIKSIFDGVIKFIKGVFTGDWKTAWEGITSIFSGIWKIVWGTIKFVFQSLINWISTFAEAIWNVITWPFKKLGEFIQFLSGKNNKDNGGGGHHLAHYASGTNYVPSDGLAYLHQGEAVIPAKYNQPYQPTNNAGLENAINSLTVKVTEIGNQVKQGIDVHGEFKQRGSDLVAVVQKGQNRNGNQPLSNPAYAR